MSRAKTSLTALCLVLGACATTPDPEAEAQAELARAIEDAMTPATAEEIEAANNSDPLTKANFWANEYTKRPEDLDVALTFVAALRGIGSNERAIEVLSQSLIVHPDNPDVLMTLGRVFSAENNLMGAARAFEKTAIVAPDRAEAWSAFGITLDKMERHDMAQAAYDKALALEPTRTSTLANYGLSLALQGDLPAAEAKLRLAAEQPNADLRVTENLALILGLQGRYDEMAAVSSRFAPESIVKKNTALLQQMIQPVRSWEALEENSSVPAQPPAELAEPPKAAPTQPVDQSAVGLAGPSEAEEDTTAPAQAGLRLRRTPG